MALCSLVFSSPLFFGLLLFPMETVSRRVFWHRLLQESGHEWVMAGFCFSSLWHLTQSPVCCQLWELCIITRSGVRKSFGRNLNHSDFRAAIGSEVVAEPLAGAGIYIERPGEGLELPEVIFLHSERLDQFGRNAILLLFPLCFQQFKNEYI